MKSGVFPLLSLLPLVLSSPIPHSAGDHGTCSSKPHNVVDCIHKYKVEIVTNSSPEFQSAVHPFNTRVPFEPLAVTIPKTASEVSIAVQCARIYKVKVAARSGGHSYGGYNLGGKDGSLVIDLLNFHQIKVNEDTGVAEVGPAARVGNLATELYKYGRGLAFGTCPGVGVGGHVLHGGLGPHTRLWGVLLDNILDMQVVLADGSISKVNAESNPELFWALRGAGSSYGIVTKFRFKTYPAPKEVINFDLTLPETVLTTASGKVDLILALQEFGLDAPKEIGLQIFYLNGVFMVSGMYFGTDGVSGYESAIEPLVNKLPKGAEMKVAKLGYLETLMKAGMVKSLDVPVVGYNASEAFFSTSLTITEGYPMTREMLTPFFENLEPTNPALKNVPITWLVLAELHGGGNSALNSAPQSSSSFAHRDTLFTWQFLGVTPDAQPPFPQSGIDFIHNIFNSITAPMPKEEVKGYVNMFDSTLDADEAHRRYYGNGPWDGKEGSVGVYEKLVGLKEKWDPQSVFWNPQAIGV